LSYLGVLSKKWEVLKGDLPKPFKFT